MALIKGKQEFRTILDFSKDKISKNKVKRALREAEVHEVTELPDSNSFTFVENGIKIGMYQIQIIFPWLSADRKRTRLREYGGFKVAIFERRGNIIQNINLSTDRRFKHQYWADLNKDYDIRMKNLTDIIMFVKRLDSLKMFL